MSEALRKSTFLYLARCLVVWMSYSQDYIGNLSAQNLTFSFAMTPIPLVNLVVLLSEAYSGPYKTSMMEFFKKIVELHHSCLTGSKIRVSLSSCIFWY